ncbi:hypothetical protein [Streptomyces sp. JW3]|uniref:hypothetical protein n=1 Tax=Streptomyces sp. JW3 TaxID=3456955 RepID=UPI003FA4C89C
MGGSLLLAYGKLFHSLGFSSKLGHAVDLDAVREDFRSLWIDTSSLDPLLAVAAREAGFVDRLVFGSDAPWGSASAVRRALGETLPAEMEDILLRGQTFLGE